MHKAREYRASLILAGAIAGSALVSGCGGRAPVYDADRHEHRWDGREDAANRRYVTDQHLEHREFSRLNADDRRSYWDWWERHPD